MAARTLRTKETTTPVHVAALSCINEYKAIDRQVVDMCTSSLRALIAAYGWMLPREVEMVYN